MGEGAEAGFPEVAHVFEPGHCVSDRRRIDVAAVHAAVFLADEQAGILEDAHVFRDRGKRHLERLGKLRDRAFAARETSQHRPARGIGESSERAVEDRRRIVNQRVNYLPRMRKSQVHPKLRMASRLR